MTSWKGFWVAETLPLFYKSNLPQDMSKLFLPYCMVSFTVANHFDLA